MYTLEQLLIKGRKSKAGGIKRKIYQWLIRHYFTADIPLDARIADTVRFPHAGLYVVISSYSVVEDNVVIQHGVTLGASKGYENAPIIKKNAILGAKATIIGKVTVGENCIVGAGAIVTKDVPDNHTVIGTNVIKPNTDAMKTVLEHFASAAPNSKN